MYEVLLLENKKGQLSIWPRLAAPFWPQAAETGDTLVIEEHVGTITKVVFNGKELPLMTKSKL